MTWTSPALAAALASALVLSACTGGDSDADPTAEATSRTADASTATGGDGDEVTATAPEDGATATGDAAAGTDGSSATSQPAAAADEAVIGTADAEDIAYGLLRNASLSQIAGGSRIADRQGRAFTGAELEASEGATTLREIDLQPSIAYAFEEPNVLAISRDDGEQPWGMLVQTVPESGLPELHEIISEDEGETWRLSWSAPMLPGTEIGQFDRRSEGTPMLREGQGELAHEPLEVVQWLTDYVAYPLERDLPEVRTHGYAPAVREQLQSQAAAVDVQASFTNSHEVREDTVRTYQLADGSGLTVAVVDRESVFDVRDGMELTAPETFTAFTGDGSITEQAEVDSLLFFAVHIPEGEGVPEVVAAREQVVGASGE